MLYLAFPVGGGYGWGICSQQLAKHLAGRTAVTFYTEGFGPGATVGPLEYHLLAPMVRPRESVVGAKTVDGPVLQMAFNDSLMPWEPRLKGRFNAGYVFFEHTHFSAQHIENARRHFDILVAGSSWAEAILRSHGLESTSTVIQGVEPKIFNPSGGPKEVFRDRFVVFSGGKFELRKGQDLVIKAFAAFARTHSDALLVACWFNPWRSYLESMSISPYIRFRPGKDFLSSVEAVLHDEGINPSQVILLPPQPHGIMAQVYKNTDVGIFPNRCEGGTNLVLMEYMACGRAPIATYTSGHTDVLQPSWPTVLTDLKPMLIQREGRPWAEWEEPTVDQLVAALEWAYDHPSELKNLGKKAAQAIAPLTWERAAERFWEILSFGP